MSSSPKKLRRSARIKENGIEHACAKIIRYRKLKYGRPAQKKIPVDNVTLELLSYILFDPFDYFAVVNSCRDSSGGPYTDGDSTGDSADNCAKDLPEEGNPTHIDSVEKTNSENASPDEGYSTQTDFVEEANSGKDIPKEGNSSQADSQVHFAKDLPEEGTSTQTAALSENMQQYLMQRYTPNFLEDVFVSLGFFRKKPDRINPNVEINHYPTTSKIMEISGLLQKYDTSEQGPSTRTPVD